MRLTGFALFLAFLATCSVASAAIENLDWWDGPGGALNCTASGPTFSYNEYAATISGTQFSSGYGVTDITTDSALDPTLILTTDINNDTSFPWTGYDVAVSMANTFTLSAAAVIPPPGDWSVVTTAPVWDPFTSQYVATIDFSGGTPIAIGNDLEFSYKLAFSGNTYYAFTQAMMPVPEPSTIALLGASFVGLLAWRWRTRGR